MSKNKKNINICRTQSEIDGVYPDCIDWCGKCQK